MLIRGLTLNMQHHRFQTYLLIGSIVCAWVYCMLWIESAGNIYKNRKNHIHFRKDAVTIVSDRSKVLTRSRSSRCWTKAETIKAFLFFFLQASRWYNLFFFFVTCEFLLGCQHMVVACAVARWFFTRWHFDRYHNSHVNCSRTEKAYDGNFSTFFILPVIRRVCNFNKFKK